MTTEQALTAAEPSDEQIKLIYETVCRHYNSTYSWQGNVEGAHERALAEHNAIGYAQVKAVLALHRPEQAEKDRKDAERYRLLRDWCVRQHRLYVTDGNNPVYEGELDSRLDAAIDSTKGESK